MIFMRKIALFFIIAFLSIPYFVSSQETGKSKFLDNWSINVNGGASIFWGDIRQYKFYPVYHFENERKVSYGIILSKQLSPTFELRGQLINGELAGTNRGTTQRYFEADIFEYNINTTINFSQLFLGSNPDRKLNIYGVLGIGFLDFRTVKKVLGTNTFDYSRGYSEDGAISEKMQTETVIPLGFGFKYQISKHFEVNLENTFNVPNTDLLDATTGDFKYDFFTYTSLGLTYKFNLRGGSKGTKTGVLNNKATYKDDSKTSDEVNQRMKDLEDKINSQYERVKDLEDQVNKLEEEAKNRPPEINIEEIKREVYKSILDTLQRTGVKTIVSDNYLQFSVFFDVNKYTISEEEESKVASIAELIKKEKELKLRIVGHCDQSGSVKYNNYLSKKRAEAITNMLIKKFGTDKSRFTVDHKGESEPFSEKHYSVNRRVDFIKK